MRGREELFGWSKVFGLSNRAGAGGGGKSPLMKMEKTTESFRALVLMCGRLRMAPLLSKEATFLQYLVVISVRQVFLLEGPEMRATKKWKIGFIC